MDYIILAPVRFDYSVDTEQVYSVYRQNVVHESECYLAYATIGQRIDSTECQSDYDVDCAFWTFWDNVDEVKQKANGHIEDFDHYDGFHGCAQYHYDASAYQSSDHCQSTDHIDFGYRAIDFVTLVRMYIDECGTYAQNDLVQQHH